MTSLMEYFVHEVCSAGRSLTRNDDWSYFRITAQFGTRNSHYFRYQFVQLLVCPKLVSVLRGWSNEEARLDIIRNLWSLPSSHILRFSKSQRRTKQLFGVVIPIDMQDTRSSGAIMWLRGDSERNWWWYKSPSCCFGVNTSNDVLYLISKSLSRN